MLVVQGAYSRSHPASGPGYATAVNDLGRIVPEGMGLGRWKETTGEERGRLEETGILVSFRNDVVAQWAMEGSEAAGSGPQREFSQTLLEEE